MTLLHTRPVSFDSTWAKVEGAVFGVDLARGRGLSQSDWMRMYGDVYKLCTSPGKPDAVFFRLKHALQQHVQGIQRSLHVGGGELIDEYLQRWNEFADVWGSLQHLFSYLDRYWIRQNTDDMAPEPPSAGGICPVHGLAMSTWKESLFDKVKGHLFKRAMELIGRDRRGEAVNLSCVRALVDSYVNLGTFVGAGLGVYREDLERGFLEETRAWYLSESQRVLSSASVDEYVLRAEEWLQREERRAQLVLDASSQLEVKRACEQGLITPHKEIIYGEADRLLEENRVAELRKLFLVLGRTEKGLGPLQDSLRRFVEVRGRDALQSLDQAATKDAWRFIEVVWGVYEEAAGLVRAAFDNEAQFVAALDQACRKWINGSAKSAEMLARYVHGALERGGCDEAAVERALRVVAVLFRYIERKDTFERFYAQFLARRLVHASSASEEAEEAVLKTLGHICGLEYTQKLQRMLMDKSISRDLCARFGAWHAGHAQAGPGTHTPDFGVLVLTAGAWPLEAHPGACALPLELAGFVGRFTDWYSQQHSGRKLTWVHHISRAELLCCFTPVKYELQVSLHQLAVLLCFNRAGWAAVPAGELAAETSLSEADLKRALQGLLKSRLLLAEGAGAEADLPAALALNRSFSSKRPKVRLSGSAVHSEAQESESVHKAVEEDRRMGVQAALVRVIKARKELGHAELLSETVALLAPASTSAPPRPRPAPAPGGACSARGAGPAQARAADVKASIDILIEKEYIARVEGNMNRYAYVA
eukprot:tig00000789_g4141.t1